jgi:antitoxin (DNA-binding transcriptional repressor) of toxin-antitoxin stability system
MTTISVGEIKPRFSDVIRQIRKGREFAISFGRKKEKVAMLIPYSVKSATGGKRKNGGKVKNDLDQFIGTWVDDPEFDKALESFEKIDKAMWK